MNNKKYDIPKRKNRPALTIDKYEMNNVLAHDDNGRAWIKIGKKAWQLAHLILSEMRTSNI